MPEAKTPTESTMPVQFSSGDPCEENDTPTQGPWCVKPDPQPWLRGPTIQTLEPEVIVSGSVRREILIQVASVNIHGGSTMANAHLIAAAPNLKNGCNALLGLLQLLAARDDVSDDLRKALTSGHRIDEARAAVAKSEGN